MQKNGYQPKKVNIIEQTPNTGSRVISSNTFTEEVKNNNMTPIEILNWYRNFYRTENSYTEQGIMVNAINDIFMRLTDMGLSNDERLIMSNEDYKLSYKNKQQTIKKLHETSNKYNDNAIRTNKKLIKLIDLIQTSINNPNTDITYDLDLLKDELEAENNRIESEKEYI